jgi:predicted dehydrogenase
MNQPKKPVTAIIMGVGSRGRECYGAYALRHPDRIKFIAVADPNEGRCKIFQKEHNIPDDMAFSSWEELLEKGKIADVAFITTPDRMHYKPAMKSLELGYDILLEKPIAPVLEEAQSIEKLAQQVGKIVQVGHVLRFTDFWNKIKHIIDSGQIGKVIHYEHSENVSYYHFGHSFVRGVYKNTNTSNPLILSKTCHDLDLMYWILGRAVRVQSTGSLTFYRPENAPKDAPIRCTDGCPHADKCPWYAPRLYMTGEEYVRIGTEVNSKIIRLFTKAIMKHKKIVKFMTLFDKRANTLLNWDQWPATVLTTDLTPEGKMKALREGQFGLCIYRCGNDVVDHMVSTFEYPDGVTATLIVHGLSEHEGREIRVFGSKGTIRGYFRYYGEKIDVTDLRYRKIKTVYKAGISLTGGHGGGDEGLMNKFTSVLLGEISAEEAKLTTISSAMESHYMGFAAEKARLTHTAQEIDQYRPK